MQKLKSWLLSRKKYEKEIHQLNPTDSLQLLDEILTELGMLSREPLPTRQARERPSGLKKRQFIIPISHR